MFGNEPSNSPQSGNNSPRSLDQPPPRPPSQRKSPSVLFTPPMDENAGMGAMGADPMVQDTMAMAQIDKAFQTLAVNHPEAVPALSQLQMSARQLYAGIIAAQSQTMMGGMQSGMGAMVPPLPMEGGMTSGQQQGPGI